MKNVRQIASPLSLLAGILSVVLALVFVYALVVLTVNAGFPSARMPVAVNDATFKIYFPFTQSPFLLGDYTAGFLTSFFLSALFYAIFFLVLKNVFKVFRHTKWFTRYGVKTLQRFYFLNLAAPVLFVLLVLIFRYEIRDIILPLVLHLVIGVFAFFMFAIFNQGVLLQEEQDLTL